MKSSHVQVSIPKGLVEKIVKTAKQSLGAAALSVFALAGSANLAHAQDFDSQTAVAQQTAVTTTQAAHHLSDKEFDQKLADQGYIKHQYTFDEIIKLKKAYMQKYGLSEKQISLFTEFVGGPLGNYNKFRKQYDNVYSDKPETVRELASLLTASLATITEKRDALKIENPKQAQGLYLMAYQLSGLPIPNKSNPLMEDEDENLFSLDNLSSLETIDFNDIMETGIAMNKITNIDDVFSEIIINVTGAEFTEPEKTTSGLEM